MRMNYLFPSNEDAHKSAAPGANAVPKNCDEERKERHARYEEQHQEWCIQMQIHQDNMCQQSQFMTAMMQAMIENHGARTLFTISPVIPTMNIHFNHKAIQRQERTDAKRGERKCEESNLERGDGQFFSDCVVCFWQKIIRLQE